MGSGRLDRDRCFGRAAPAARRHGQREPGGRWPPASNGFYYVIDSQGLFTHELGHALGMNHSGLATALMCGCHPVANPGTVCDYLDNNGPADGLATINRGPAAGAQNRK